MLQSSIAQHGNAGLKTAAGAGRHKTDKEKKIGHRRVGVGGEITYKKVMKINSKFEIQIKSLKTNLIIMHLLSKDPNDANYGIYSTGYTTCYWRPCKQTRKRFTHAGLHDGRDYEFST